MEAVRAAAFFILGKWRSWITAALVNIYAGEFSKIVGKCENRRRERTFVEEKSEMILNV